MLSYYVEINPYLGLYIEQKQRSRVVRSWRPSSASMVHLTISSLIMHRWNEAKLLYRSCASTTYNTALLSCIIHNRNLLRGEYKSIIRSQTLPLIKLVLPDMCDCMTFCSGLVYITLYTNLYMDTALLMKLPLEPPLTLEILCNIHSGTLSTTMI